MTEYRDAETAQQAAYGDAAPAARSGAPSPVTAADAADAARLVSYGLQPKLLPARDAEYAEHFDDDTFRPAARLAQRVRGFGARRSRPGR